MLKKIVISLVIALSFSVNANAEMSAKDIYYTLMSFDGEWKFIKGEQQGSCTRGDDADAAVVYKMIGKETAIQEDLMPGSAYQMVTMYHLEDPKDVELIGTHYCVKKNQPAYRADLKK